MRIHPLFARPAGSDATHTECIEVDLFTLLTKAFSRSVLFGGLVCDPILVYRVPAHACAEGR